MEAYIALLASYESRVASGEVEDWASYERRNYGYPSYEHQSYGYDAAITYIRKSALHIRKVCENNDIQLDALQVADFDQVE